ncbi:MAG TPA: GTP-binding protein [Thermoplasmata archaeon]|nr:GTP-binding protein [Thermoplasmata archaeon]
MVRGFMVDDHIKRKVLLLGDGAVGKTSLIRRFVVDKFSDDYITTIGTKVTKKDLRVEYPDRAVDLTFMIWDVLGQKGYKNIQESAFVGGKGALLVYDVTRADTIRSLTDYWLRNLGKVLGSIPFVLVGNKIDLVDDRTQGEETLEYLKESLGVRGFLSSAKTGESVEPCFLQLARDIVAKADARLGRHQGPEEEAPTLIAVTDQIVTDFCDLMGGQEAAMPIVRQQMSRAGVDVNSPTPQGLRLAVEYLADAESSFRNADEVEATKLRRLGWIKEAS